MSLPQTQVFQAYEKFAYQWQDRNGVSAPDFTGVHAIPANANVYASTAGTLVISADSTTAGARVEVVVVLWDCRGNPLTVIPGCIALSGWATNQAGNFICAGNGWNNPGFFAVDISLAAGYSILVQSIMPQAATVNLHWKLF